MRDRHTRGDPTGPATLQRSGKRTEGAPANRYINHKRCVGGGKERGGSAFKKSHPSSPRAPHPCRSVSTTVRRKGEARGPVARLMRQRQRSCVSRTRRTFHGRARKKQLHEPHTPRHAARHRPDIDEKYQEKRTNRHIMQGKRTSRQLASAHVSCLPMTAGRHPSTPLSHTGYQRAHLPHESNLFLTSSQRYKRFVQAQHVPPGRRVGESVAAAPRRRGA